MPPILILQSCWSSRRILEKSFQKTGMLICVLISMKLFSHLLYNHSVLLITQFLYLSFSGLVVDKQKGRQIRKTRRALANLQQFSPKCVLIPCHSIENLVQFILQLLCNWQTKNPHVGNCYRVSQVLSDHATGDLVIKSLFYLVSFLSACQLKSVISGRVRYFAI